MWVSIGNTVIFLAFIYIFFWIPQIPPKEIEKALNDEAIRMAGVHTFLDIMLEKPK